MATTVRRYHDTDQAEVFNLLARRGIVSDTATHRDMVRRAHSLATTAFVAEDELRTVRALIVLFPRSPDVLWGADLAADTAENSMSPGVFAVWYRALEFARDNDYALITTQPKPGQRRLRDLFRIMGLLPVGEDEMETPLPLCERMWAAVGDNGLLPPRASSDGHLAIFRGRKTYIEIDRQTGLARCLWSQPSKSGSLAAKPVYYRPITRLHRSLPDRRMDDGVTRCCEEVLATLASGWIHISEEALSILPAWWTSIPTRGLDLPVGDHWPMLIRREARGIRVVPDGSAPVGHVVVVHLGEHRHRLEFSGSDNMKCARITLETDRAVHATGSIVELPTHTLVFHPAPDAIQSRKWNGCWRTHVHFTSAEPSCIVERRCQASATFCGRV